MKKNNKKWFSLIIAMGLVVVMSLAAVFILDYIIPFSKNVSWLENSSKAYYQANIWIENALLEISQNDFGFESLNNLENNTTAVIDSGYAIVANGSSLPPVWEGNSEYDHDRNRISPGKPIQLEVWNGSVADWNNFGLFMRVPDLNENGYNANGSNTDEVVDSLWPIIYWQLSSVDNILFATGSSLESSEIQWFTQSLWWRNGQTLDGTLMDFDDYYSNNCWVWKKCSLKLSVINELKTNGIQIPYLEWRIFTHGSIALRYAKISASWQSYGYRKDIQIKIPQQTVNEAFDLTIFQ
jgi:hypothetical protein